MSDVVRRQRARIKAKWTHEKREESELHDEGGSRTDLLFCCLEESELGNDPDGCLNPAFIVCKVTSFQGKGMSRSRFLNRIMKTIPLEGESNLTIFLLFLIITVWGSFLRLSFLLIIWMTYFKIPILGKKLLPEIVGSSLAFSTRSSDTENGIPYIRGILVPS